MKIYILLLKMCICRHQKKQSESGELTLRIPYAEEFFFEDPPTNTVVISPSLKLTVTDYKEEILRESKLLQSFSYHLLLSIHCSLPLSPTRFSVACLFARNWVCKTEQSEGTKIVINAKRFDVFRKKSKFVSRSRFYERQ